MNAGDAGRLAYGCGVGAAEQGGRACGCGVGAAEQAGAHAAATWKLALGFC